MKILPRSDYRMVKQTLLIKTKKPIIIYDYREEKSKVIYYLKKNFSDLILVRQKLDVGDYIVGKIYGIERKTADDLYKSILDGRIYDQVSRLKEVYEKPIIIIENFESYLYLEKEYKAIISIIAENMIKNSVMFFFSKDPESTAYFLYKLAYFEQINLNNRVIIGVKRKNINKEAIAINLLTSLPGIGLKKAKEILNRFGSIRNFVNSSISDLISLKIGSEKAKLIKEILEYDFRKK